MGILSDDVIITFVSLLCYSSLEELLMQCMRFDLRANLQLSD